MTNKYLVLPINCPECRQLIGVTFNEIEVDECEPIMTTCGWCGSTLKFRTRLDGNDLYLFLEVVITQEDTKQKMEAMYGGRQWTRN